MLGMPGANMDESEITTPSQASRALCCSMNGARCSLPISSSPSAITMTLTGSDPRTASSVSSAATCAKSWPLSSTLPRANSLPSRMVGSKAGEVQSSSGSGGCTS